MTGAPPRRALIMAGGGCKVAFQAGVLQVWLDEARDPEGRQLIFDIADGASGGALNLALWCQGLSGRQIADRWRTLRPLRGLSINWPSRRRKGGRSLFDYDAFRTRVLQQDWALDWDRIRSTTKTATFNLFNVSTQRHEVRPAARMSEDALISAISLPMWFPPVSIEGDDYMDAVYATDANLQAAIAAGADEVWIVWTVSQRGTHRPGFVGEYFGIIEASANAGVREALARIERNNAADDGLSGEYGRRISVRWLAAEVPAHYLLNVTRASMREAVDRGVEVARAWCTANGFSVLADRSDPAVRSGGGLSFRETMRGRFRFGSGVQPPSAAQDCGEEIALALTVTVADVEALIADPRHRADVSGTVRSEALGGRRPITGGVVELLTDDGDPFRKRMTYRLRFTDDDGDPIILIGNKTVVHQAGTDDLWSDTSTLQTWLLRGDHLDASAGPEVGDQPEQIGTGVITLSRASFLRQLTTFRADAGSTGGARHTLFSFGQFFLRQLWQVYLHPTSIEQGPQFQPPAAPAVTTPRLLEVAPEPRPASVTESVPAA